MAQKKTVTRQDLVKLPLICSRQVLQQTAIHNEFAAWFGKDFAALNIVATYNLVFNAALLAEQGVGYVLSLDKLIDTRNSARLCFRPFEPALESGLDIVWKKYQIFSPAARIFLEKLQNKLKA